MATKKSIRVGDCSSFPFSVERAAIIRSGFTAGDERLSDQPLADTPTGFRLREIPGRAVLSWPLLVPERDDRGVLTGEEFECWKKPQESKFGIASYQYSIKRQGVLNCHSALEARLMMFFDFCPFVLNIRTQYPSWCREEYARYHRENRPFPKQKVMTIDFLLTLQLPGNPRVAYHGVSAKPLSLITGEKVVKRHQKEASRLKLWAATHEVMHELTVPDTEHRNYLLLHQWMVHLDISRYWPDALNFSGTLLRSSVGGSLDRVLGIIGRRAGFCLDDSYRLFAVAVFMGYLSPNHRYRLDIDEPLVLLNRSAFHKKELPSYLL